MAHMLHILMEILVKNKCRLNLMSNESIQHVIKNKIYIEIDLN